MGGTTVQVRDRIKELRRVRAADLRPNPKNWRIHPEAQQNALRGLLAEIGYAGALLARELADGSLELIDGHLRAETTPDQEVPVLVLDVTEEEADKILATHDPLVGLAGVDHKALSRLVDTTNVNNPAAAAMLQSLTAKCAGERADGDPRQELEITPELFERQDYLVVLFDNAMDWQVACERLGVKTVRNGVVDKKSTICPKGLGRVIPAKVLLRELGYG